MPLLLVLHEGLVLEEALTAQVKGAKRSLAPCVKSSLRHLPS